MVSELFFYQLALIALLWLCCMLHWSRALKVRGGIISQANRYLGGFCSSQGIFPPQIIQVLLKTLCLQRSHFRPRLQALFIGLLRLKEPYCENENTCVEGFGGAC